MKSLKICHWNANGLSQHKNELKIFLTTNKIDIMLISETHLTKFNNFNIEGYKLYDTKHPLGKAHGGTAIMVKNRVKHFPLEEFCKENIHSTSICIEEGYKKLILSAVYCPPRFKITENQYNEFFKSLGPCFIAAGDFNAKHLFWGSRLITPRGRQFYSTILKRF